MPMSSDLVFALPDIPTDKVFESNTEAGVVRGGWGRVRVALVVGENGLSSALSNVTRYSFTCGL